MNTAKAEMVTQSFGNEHTSSERVDYGQRQFFNAHSTMTHVQYDGAAGDHAGIIIQSAKSSKVVASLKNKKKTPQFDDDAGICCGSGAGDCRLSVNTAMTSIHNKFSTAAGKAIRAQSNRTEGRFSCQCAASRMFAPEADHMIFAETDCPNVATTDMSSCDWFFADEDSEHSAQTAANVTSMWESEKICAVGDDNGVGVAKNFSFDCADGDADRAATMESSVFDAVQLILFEVIDASVYTAARKNLVSDVAAGGIFTAAANDENSKLEALQKKLAEVINASVQAQVERLLVYGVCKCAAAAYILPTGKRDYRAELNNFKTLLDAKEFSFIYPAGGHHVASATEKESALEAETSIWSDVEEELTPSVTCGKSFSKVPVICQYYLRGSCRYGSNCNFLHDLSDNQDLQHETKSIESTGQGIASTTDWYNFGIYMYDIGYTSLAESQVINSCKHYLRNELCPLEGPCPHGIYCAYGMHLELCKMCDKYCLHPLDQEQRRKHHRECLQRHEQDMELAFAVARSKDKTCNICLDVVVERPEREKRFGILSDCSHIFCLSCIRNWRSTQIDRSKEAGRSCPLCRTKSDFVIPSAFWPETKEEKDQLFQKYRAALRIRDCKYFQQGAGVCKFGNRCFYKHALPNGEHVDLGSPRRTYRC